MSTTSIKPRFARGLFQSQNGLDLQAVLPEEVFRRMISLERKRSERTQRPFVLLLIDTGCTQPTGNNGWILPEIVSALQTTMRETDVVGWHETNSVVGVLFTEITPANDLIFSTVLSRINTALRGKVAKEQFGEIKFSCHLFPEELGRIGPVSESTIWKPQSEQASAD